MTPTTQATNHAAGRPLPGGVRRYLAPMRRRLVRIAGIADAQTRQAEFRAFWARYCVFDCFDPRLAIPRSLRKGYAAPRTWAEPVYSVAVAS
jgi:hypothetical protein